MSSETVEGRLEVPGDPLNIEFLKKAIDEARRLVNEPDPDLRTVLTLLIDVNVSLKDGGILPKHPDNGSELRYMSLSSCYIAYELRGGRLYHNMAAYIRCVESV